MSSEHAVKRAVIARALKDPAYRASLLADPAAAIKAETGVTVPAGETVKVVEDTASVVHFHVPRVRADERDEGADVPEKKAPEPSADAAKAAKKRSELKAALAKDPKAAVEAATGAKLPAGVKIVVVEDTAAVVHLILPFGKTARS